MRKACVVAGLVMLAVCGVAAGVEPREMGAKEFEKWCLDVNSSNAQTLKSGAEAAQALEARLKGERNTTDLGVWVAVVCCATEEQESAKLRGEKTDYNRAIALIDLVTQTLPDRTTLLTKLARRKAEYLRLAEKIQEAAKTLTEATNRFVQKDFETQIEKNACNLMLGELEMELKQKESAIQRFGAAAAYQWINAVNVAPNDVFFKLRDQRIEALNHLISAFEGDLKKLRELNVEPAFWEYTGKARESAIEEAARKQGRRTAAYVKRAAELKQTLEEFNKRMKSSVVHWWGDVYCEKMTNGDRDEQIEAVLFFRDVQAYEMFAWMMTENDHSFRAVAAEAMADCIQPGDVKGAAIALGALEKTSQQLLPGGADFAVERYR